MANWSFHSGHLLGTVSIYIICEQLRVSLSKQNAVSPRASVKNLRYKSLNMLASVVEHLAQGLVKSWWKKKCCTLIFCVSLVILVLWIIIFGIIQTNMSQLLLALQNGKMKCRKNRMSWSQESKFAVWYQLCSVWRCWELGLMRPFSSQGLL